METAKFYWTVMVGVVGAIWVIVQLVRDRNTQSIARTNAAINRLFAIDQLVIDKPATQRYLSETADREVEYFRAAARLQEDVFYQAKTLAYMYLNTFDEILSLSAPRAGLLSLFGRDLLIEPADWERYIEIKLRHPLYRSILEHEQEIFGQALRGYWQDKKTRIINADPFLW